MNHTNKCILSIDVGGTFLKVSLVLYDGTLIKDSFFKVPVDSNGSAEDIQSVFTQVAALGAGLSRKYNLTLTGIGVCIPGPFDYADGICRMKHKYASIYGIPMRPWLEQATGRIPIQFFHDSTAFILGATWKNAYAGYGRACGVMIGTGLGFASMFDSIVFHNPQGGPGISICARPYRVKTAEEYVSRHALIAHYNQLVRESSKENAIGNIQAFNIGAMDHIDAVDIAHLAFCGQSQAVRAFHDMGIYLAEILYDILKENKFECLLLGGGISKSADLFLPAMRQVLSNVPALKVIETADDIDNAPLLGTARALLDRPGGNIR